MNLANKNVVYLGGFGGIGQKACAELLERQLQALAVFDLTLNEKLLADWQAKYSSTKIFYQKLDITKKSEIEAAYKEAVERMQHIDLVINGMGLMDDRYVDLTIQINLLGVVNSCLTALEYMDKSKGGQGGLVVNISSVAGIQPTPTMAIYSAAKHGVTALTRGLADPAYFAHSGVAFITICPGFTDTPLLHEMVDKSTFTFDTPMKHVIPRVKRQAPEVCAQNLVKVIEQGQNGSVWLLDVGEMKQIEMPLMWRPQLEA
ncbi:hypothetical protein KR222_002378 [Zaprionus bogoriensis]|nr:hypothetical protein KR222_002378 [Zaprionus bogoriensis]